MTDNSDDHLSGEDKKAWQEVSEGARSTSGHSPSTQPSSSSKKVATSSEVRNALDPRLFEKLAKGKRQVDRVVDLHDHTLDEAYQYLEEVLQQAYQTQKRLLLVITGKGAYQQDGDNRLSIQAPRWFKETSLKQYVGAFCHADQKHGGEGALYVQVKKSVGV